MILTYQEWCEKNEGALDCMFAEEGMDREYDWDRDEQCEIMYEDYVSHERLRRTPCETL